MYIPIWIIMVLLATWIYYSNKQKKQPKFSPFLLTISPNWYLLLKEYKLINDKEWDAIRKKLEKETGAEKYNILYNGISFTVLKASVDDDDLIYNNNRNYFKSEVDFRERIEEIKIKTDLFPYSPWFSIKWGVDGYEISITTPESSKNLHMVGDDGDLIKITTIPYSIFKIPKYRLGMLKPEQEQQLLKKYGWTLNDRDIEDDIAGWPYQLKHKFFDVEWRYI